MSGASGARPAVHIRYLASGRAVRCSLTTNAMPATVDIMPRPDSHGHGREAFREGCVVPCAPSVHRSLRQRPLLEAPRCAASVSAASVPRPEAEGAGGTAHRSHPVRGGRRGTRGGVGRAGRNARTHHRQQMVVQETLPTILLSARQMTERPTNPLSHSTGFDGSKRESLKKIK